VKVTKI